MLRMNETARVDDSGGCKKIFAPGCRGQLCQIYHRVTPFLSWPLPVSGLV